MRFTISIFVILLSLAACQSFQQKPTFQLNEEESTYSNFDSVTTKHLEWNAAVDFDKKQIRGTATWSFSNSTHSPFIRFDSYDLSISKVLVNGKDAKFYTGDFNEEYGSALVIPIKDNDSLVRIEYSTGANAKALQWLEPSQTAGKIKPFLFTQCESIQARSLLPCQDVPAIRITYNADVTVPSGMIALMSAKNPTQKNANGNYHFEMEIPIPSYLIALAVGDMEYKAIDERSGVYTEPVLLDKAAVELSDIPNMMKAAEAICGPYKWGKYDVMVAPPSFPIGGMENPRLTFSTPTIIAGDKSLVSLIAHEMAHSWSGNLVTNANWSDIWLNEGFTTYFERRIMESIAGKTYNDMLWELGYQDMQSDFTDMGLTNPDTKLKIELNGRNPENAFSNIPYEKGAVFLRMLEENTGREKFDAYLNSYFQNNAFTPMTTKKCLAYMDEHLFNNDTLQRNKLKVNEWVFGAGLPDNCPHVNPERFIAVDAAREAFEKSGNAKNIKAKDWTTHEWLQFLRKINHPLPLEKMKDLDQTFSLTTSGNSEIVDEWFKLAISSDYKVAYPAMEKFLGSVGRKKFLEPLYGEMIKTEKGKEMARRIFNQSKQNYHPLTASKIQKILYSKY